MRKVIFENPNHMQIDTGHREYDAAVGALGTGNLIDGGQYSSHIRAWTTPTNPGGNICAPGAMQIFDLKGFGTLPAPVRDYLAEVAKDEDVILYDIRHTTSRRDEWGERIVTHHGYIVTRDHTNDYVLLKKFYCGPTHKSRRVVDVAAEYVSNEPERSFGPTDLNASPRRRPSALAERALVASL
jgi:hypothetical protein